MSHNHPHPPAAARRRKGKLGADAEAPPCSIRCRLGVVARPCVRSQVSARRVTTQWWVPRATQASGTWKECQAHQAHVDLMSSLFPEVTGASGGGTIRLKHTLIETREKQEPSWLEPSPLSPPCDSPDPSLQVQATGKHRWRRHQLFFTVKGKLRPSPPCGDSAATAGGSQDAA